MSFGLGHGGAGAGAEGVGEGRVRGMFPEFTYENTRRQVYQGGATFVPVCEKCGRYVKADPCIYESDAAGLKDAPNATCRKCGRTKMLFEGFM
jgi:hypothetical protein